jgi:hypothetical protein
MKEFHPTINVLVRVFPMANPRGHVHNPCIEINGKLISARGYSSLDRPIFYRY